MMDARVYDVDVCERCGAQVCPDIDGSCQKCGCFEHKTLRIRVPRDVVLAEIRPRDLLIEKSLYFGCVRQLGHYLHDASLRNVPYSATPWGSSLDGGLFPRGEYPPEGEAHVFHRGDWTAVAFTDLSIDTRGGSWSVFCIPATLDGPEALDIARAAFPSVFARYTFDVRLAR